MSNPWSVVLWRRTTRMKKEHQGAFRGTTADEILEELKPSPVRWNELAAFVIQRAEGPTRRHPHGP